MRRPKYQSNPEYFVISRVERDESVRIAKYSGILCHFMGIMRFVGQNNKVIRNTLSFRNRPPKAVAHEPIEYTPASGAPWSLSILCQHERYIPSKRPLLLFLVQKEQLIWQLQPIFWTFRSPGEVAGTRD
jgi:hypothetical protein